MLHSMNELTVLDSITVTIDLRTGEVVAPDLIFFVIECPTGFDADSAVIALRQDGANAYAEIENGVEHIITDHPAAERFINPCRYVGIR